MPLTPGMRTSAGRGWRSSVGAAGQAVVGSPRLWLLGIVAGLAIATKFTACALLVLALLLVPGWRWKARIAMAACAAFVLGTLPILSKYGRMVAWIVQIGTHTGHYGTGHAGFIDPAKYIGALGRLVTGDLLASGMVGLSLIVAAWIALGTCFSARLFR